MMIKTNKTGNNQADNIIDNLLSQYGLLTIQEVRLLQIQTILAEVVL